MVARTILVVDDYEELRQLTEEILIGAGYQVLSAADGDEAVRLADRRGSPPDLLLTDLNLSGMPARELVTALKGLYPSIKVMVMSGSLDLPLGDPLSKLAPAAFLAKPFMADDLLKTVHSVLEDEPM